MLPWYIGSAQVVLIVTVAAGNKSNDAVTVTWPLTNGTLGYPILLNVAVLPMIFPGRTFPPPSTAEMPVKNGSSPPTYRTVKLVTPPVQGPHVLAAGQSQPVCPYAVEATSCNVKQRAMACHFKAREKKPKFIQKLYRLPQS